MLKRSSWRISVIEYKIKVDYFDQKPPDSEEKLIREFVFFSKPNVLNVDIVKKYGVTHLLLSIATMKID